MSPSAQHLPCVICVQMLRTVKTEILFIINRLTCATSDSEWGLCCKREVWQVYYAAVNANNCSQGLLHPSAGRYQQGFSTCFPACNAHMAQISSVSRIPVDASGSTGVVAWLTVEEASPSWSSRSSTPQPHNAPASDLQTKLYVSNLGDSRCVVGERRRPLSRLLTLDYLTLKAANFGYEAYFMISIILEFFFVYCFTVIIYQVHALDCWDVSAQGRKLYAHCRRRRLSWAAVHITTDVRPQSGHVARSETHYGCRGEGIR